MKQQTLAGKIAPQALLLDELAPPRPETIRATTALADPRQYSLRDFARDGGPR